jgi:hypothetical protein
MVIFDRRCIGLLSGLDLHHRVAACYAWAENRALWVADELVDATPTSGSAMTPTLQEALTTCRDSHAGLLVHSPRCLSDELRTISAILRHLDGPLMSVTCGRITAATLTDQR